MDMKSRWHGGFLKPLHKQRCGILWWILEFKVVLETYCALTTESLYCSSAYFVLHLKKNGRINIGGGSKTTRNKLAMQWTIKALFCFANFHKNLARSLAAIIDLFQKLCFYFSMMYWKLLYFSAFISVC